MLYYALLLAALSCSPAPDAFRAITYEQAKAAAGEEKKVILIDFFTTWCMPCKKLDETTWKDEGVAKWIGDHCVALKLDAEKNPELAKSFHVEAYPTVLLLKADGSVIDRLVGYKEPKEFLSDASDALAGRDSLTRAKEKLARSKEKLAGHAGDPMAHQSYADELEEAGQYEEALAEYLWCFDNGKADVSYSGVRVSFLLSDIQKLGRHYPAALKALEERRDAAEARIRKGPAEEQDVLDAVCLNQSLKQPEKSMALLDEIRKAGPVPLRARLMALHQLLEPLHEAKRYADLLALLDAPPKYVTSLIQQSEFASKSARDPAGEDKELAAMTEDILRSGTIDRCAIIFEALVATGRGPEADQVAESVIAFGASGKTYAALIRAADRAAAADRVKALGERGMASLPEKEQAVVKKAVARAAKPK